jgi:hypothetical protein
MQSRPMEHRGQAWLSMDIYSSAFAQALARQRLAKERLFRSAN